jgi:transcriptional regulator with XRE-family HTH domain
MTPEELLRLYPRATLRWLRGRLGLSQRELAGVLDLRSATVSGWEASRRSISAQPRAQLAVLLAPHLATPEGAAFARSLGRGEEETTP